MSIANLPIIDSKAALLRIPVGTRLRLVNSLMGPCDQGKQVKAIRSSSIVMENTDGPKAGRESYLYLESGEWVEARIRGFAVMFKDQGVTRLKTEYVFEEGAANV